MLHLNIFRALQCVFNTTLSLTEDGGWRGGMFSTADVMCLISIVQDSDVHMLRPAPGAEP